MTAHQARDICARIDLQKFRTMSLAHLADYADALMVRECSGLANVTKSELISFLLRTQSDLRAARTPGALVATRFH